MNDSFNCTLTPTGTIEMKVGELITVYFKYNIKDSENTFEKGQSYNITIEILKKYCHFIDIPKMKSLNFNTTSIENILILPEEERAAAIDAAFAT